MNENKTCNRQTINVIKNCVLNWERLQNWNNANVLGMEGVSCKLKGTLNFLGVFFWKMGYSTFWGEKFRALLRKKYKPYTPVSVAFCYTLLTSVITYLRSYIICTSLYYCTNYEIQFYSPNEHVDSARDRTRVVDFSAYRVINFTKWASR